MTFRIRLATPDDAEAIGRVHVQGWREAYASLLSPDFLAALSVDDRVAGHRLALRAGRRVHVLEVQDAMAGGAWTVRGFALAQPPTASDAPTGLELQLLYQLASEHGSGSGQALLEAAIGGAPAHLWMADGNARAERFYARNGFERDGGRRSEPEWEDLVEVRLVRRAG